MTASEQGELVEPLPRLGTGASGLPPTDAVALERPRLRGVLHQAGFVVACLAGVILLASLDGLRLAAGAVFAAAAAAMLGVSALYHRVAWSPTVRPRMRRLDHAAIYVLIAGTYTPVGLLALSGDLQRVVLAVGWTGAAAAIVTKVWWTRAPRWLPVAFATGLGWAGVVAMPELARTAGVAAVALLAAGGLAYTAGAVVYARRRPDPAPGVFGFHEVFHALTLVALACQYSAIAFFVLRVD